MGTGICSEDRSVKLLGPDGGLRSRRLSQEDAKRLLERGLVFARWDRRQTRIICIQFLNADEPTQAPQRWLKTGSRYSYRDGQTWKHRKLPHAAVDAHLGHTAMPELIDIQVRDLFAAPMLSIVTATEPTEGAPESPAASRTVVSIAGARAKLETKRPMRLISARLAA